MSAHRVSKSKEILSFKNNMIYYRSSKEKVLKTLIDEWPKSCWTITNNINNDLKKKK